jgi:hypothetical protein
MGAFALGKIRVRLFSSSAGLLGAGFLAFVVVLSTPGETRVSGRQLEVSKEFDLKMPDRVVIRAAGPCKGQTLPKAVLPERTPISRKLAAALVAELYCRTWPTELSKLTRMAAAFLRHLTPQRVIQVDANVAAEWPGGGFEPAPDTGMIEAFSVAPLPDG